MLKTTNIEADMLARRREYDRKADWEEEYGQRRGHEEYGEEENRSARGRREERDGRREKRSDGKFEFCTSYGGRVDNTW